MAPPLKMISIVWRIIEPSMIFLSKREQSMLYFTPIACTTSPWQVISSKLKKTFFFIFYFFNNMIFEYYGKATIYTS